MKKAVILSRSLVILSAAKNLLLLLALSAALQPFAMAQATQFPFLTLPNETTTGTTANHLVKVTGAPSKAIISTAGDTFGVIGITTNGGTAGNANIRLAGNAQCAFDGATTAGDFVGISATVNGDCTDAGATCPAGENIGTVFSTNGGAGTYTILLSIGTCSGSGGGLTGAGLARLLAFWTYASNLNAGPGDIVDLNPTTDATHGVIRLNGTPMLFSFPSGNNNAFLGADDGAGGGMAGNFTMSGSGNVGVGANALVSNTVASGNSAYGYQALFNNTTGGSNYSRWGWRAQSKLQSGRKTPQLGSLVFPVIQPEILTPLLDGHREGR